MRSSRAAVLASKFTVRRLALGSVLTVLGASGPASGQPAPASAKGSSEAAPPAATNAEEERLPVRLALSPAAADYLTDIRVRRVLAVELGGAAELAPIPNGPLDESAVQVWVDLPEPSRVILQVKAPKRRLARRRVNISGMPWDVAARFVAIAVAQMVRRQLRPLKVRTVQKPKGPTPEELEIASRRLPSLVLEGSFSAVGLPGASGGLVGPHFSLGTHGAGFHHEVHGRWLVGDAEPGALRWFEVGAGGDYRHWLHPSWRLTFGANAAMAAVRLADAEIISNPPSESDGWSARIAAALGAQARLGRTEWLALTLEPGVILREIPYQTSRHTGSVDGAWLGVRLGLVLDQPITPN